MRYDVLVWKKSQSLLASYSLVFVVFDVFSFFDLVFELVNDVDIKLGEPVDLAGQFSL